MAYEETLVCSERNQTHDNQLHDPHSAQPNPLFSIIVPVLNMEQTIRRTLDSIIDQSQDRVEIIVIDGQSADGTLERINPYRNKLAAVISEPDAGLYDAVNKGLRHANGEIVAILSGDDYYSHNEVLATYAGKFENEETGIVFGDLEFFLSSNPTRTIRTYSSRNFNPQMLRRGWMPPHPTVFVRKSVYDQIGNYCTEYKISSDFEFLIRALWLNAVRYDRVDSVVVRMQYGGLSTNGVKATYRLNNEIIQACRANGLHTSWWTILLKFPSKLAEFAPAFKYLARSAGAADAPDSRTIPH